MRKICSLIICLFAMIVFNPINTYAKIEGKLYQPGDTIVVDGVSALVYHVDNNGLNGNAIVMARSDKEIKRLTKMAEKHYKKAIKKGLATEDELNIAIKQINALSQFPFIPVDNNVYHVDEWSELLPHGWRLPSTVDAENFAIFYCGGLGKDHPIKGTHPEKELTADIFAQDMLLMISFRCGFICGDTPKPPVKFLQRCTDGLGNMNPFKIKIKDALGRFEIRDKYIGKECTVAVTDF